MNANGFRETRCIPVHSNESQWIPLPMLCLCVSYALPKLVEPGGGVAGSRHPYHFLPFYSDIHGTDPGRLPNHVFDNGLGDQTFLISVEYVPSTFLSVNISVRQDFCPSRSVSKHANKIPTSLSNSMNSLKDVDNYINVINQHSVAIYKIGVGRRMPTTA